MTTEAIARAKPVPVDTTIAEHVANESRGHRYGVDWIYHDDVLGYLPAKPVKTLEEATSAQRGQQEEAQAAAWNECNSAIIKALAAMVTVHTPDKLFVQDAIPRSPIMDEVLRIRRALDTFNKHRRTGSA